MLTPEKRQQMDAVLNQAGSGLTPEKRAQMDAVVGKNTNPLDKPKYRAFETVKDLGKGIIDQATGFPRLWNEINRGVGNAIVQPIAQARFNQLEKQPLTAERVAKQERLAEGMKRATAPMFGGLSQEDIQRTSSLPSSVGLGLQRSAGTGAFFVPGGQGASLPTKMLYGATEGFLSGASQGDNLKDVATNAAFGTVTGASVPVALAGAKKAGDISRKGAGYLSDRATLSGIGSPKSVKKAIGLSPEDSAYKFFEAGDLWDRSPESAKQAYSASRKLYKEAIDNVDGGLPAQKVVEKFDDAMSKLEPYINDSDSAQAAYNEIAKRRQDFINKFSTEFSDVWQSQVNPQGLYGSKLSAQMDKTNASFSPEANLKGKSEGVDTAYNIFKQSLDEAAPTTAKLGREQAAYKEMEKVLESYQTRGLTKRLFSLGKLSTTGVGTLIGGLPGAIGGYLLDTIVSSPMGSRIMAKTFNQLSEVELQYVMNLLNQPAVRKAIVSGATNAFSQSKNPYKSKVKTEYKF